MFQTKVVIGVLNGVTVTYRAESESDLESMKIAEAKHKGFIACDVRWM